MLLLASSVCGLFKCRQFEPEVILLTVGWYLRFSLSYRDVEELYDRRLRSDSYDPQRPSVLQYWSTAPLHSRSVRGDELKCRSSTPTFGSTTKLQHIQFSDSIAWEIG